MKLFIALKRPIACALLLDLLHSPALGLAAGSVAAVAVKVASTPPPINALPVPIGTSWTGVKGIAPGAGPNSLVITQNQPYAVINWSSFNIGAGASVNFSQKNGSGVAQPSWAALNRISDQNPSQILGSLTADGKVFLINQNGIVFGAGSQVNVHALTASALNISDQDFLAGYARFQGATQGSDVTVANYGSITTDNGGFVALVAPQVVNGGSIASPLGKISLIGVGEAPGQSYAAEFVQDALPTDYDVVYNASASAGSALNTGSGRLISDSGRVDMFGATVTQNGVIRADSTVQLSGVVNLLGTGQVTTGAGSLTSTPVTDSTVKVSQTFDYSGGSITLGGIPASPDGTAPSNVNGTPYNVHVSVEPLANIVHNGAILDPSGTVTLNATQRVYLESGSSINVAGLWVDEAASADLVTAQLNSVQLADYYNQKNGILLGANITTTRQAGSSIGDISGSYTTQDMSAQERSTAGGKIVIGAPSATDPATNANYALGQFIAKQGASLDFSGGGYNYAGGSVATTKLVSGSTVYDISNAPASLTYQEILPAVSHYVQGFVEGSNAGALSIQSRQVVLDGALSGSVTRGVYQTQTTDPTLDKGPNDTVGKDYLISVDRGLEEPVGGTLSIGFLAGPATSTALTNDFVTNSITVLAAGRPLPASFGPSDPLAGMESELSAPLLSGAGLSRLNLAANGSISIDAGARITLLPSGSYTDSTGAQVFLGGMTAKARAIVDQGIISAPGDSVEFTLQDNISSWAAIGDPLYLPLASGILLDKGSLISVAGEEVDNSLAAGTAGGGAKFGHLQGGAITIQDTTLQGTTLGDSVIVRQGAVLDVSGGYSFDTKGKLTGGNAGTLTLRGATLSIAGELDGFSLPGSTGGALVLHAGEIDVASQSAYLPDNLSLGDPVPDQLQGKLILGQDRLAATGFTRIELDAIHDVNFQSGVTFAPSTVKSALPVSAARAASGVSSSSADLTALSLSDSDTQSPDYVGASYVHVKTEKNIYASTNQDGSPIFSEPDLTAQISLPAGSEIRVIPGGGITLSTPTLEMAGTLEALGGKVSISVSNQDLVLGSGAEILAGGYNKTVTGSVMGVPVGAAPEPGGTVTLTSASGITLEKGSLIDVSGSAAVQIVTPAANGTPLAVTVASNPGSLLLNLASTLTLAGELDGQARLTGVQGGALSISNSGASLPISGADVSNYLKSGFDALTLQSTVSLDFQGSMDLTVPRSLILDAPSITGGNAGTVKLSSPWLQLNNSSVAPSPAPGVAATGETARLTLSGGYLDVNGSVQITGFSDVFAEAQQDIRLSDSNYTRDNLGTIDYYGNLYTDGNLTLQAARIYPTTLTGTPANPATGAPARPFTISAGGQVTILPAALGNSSPIYSAGGMLEIDAGAGIDLASGSVLAAPLGSITLNAPNGRIYLDSGSLISTSADASIDYGSFDGTNWYGKDLGGGILNPLVSAAPAKSITLNGNEIIVKSGATLDFSGGGSVFSYLYQPDTEGTSNPISTAGVSALTGLQTRPNNYVILPDNSVQLPGFSYTDASGKQQVAGAVYLNGMQLDNGSYLKAGVYALLPAQFAFVPGALVISDTGATVAPGAVLRTPQGYQVDGGYGTFLGTNVSSQRLEGYSIQPASVLLQEGNFTIKQYTAGNAGSVSIQAGSTVMAGSFNAAALTGYQPGSLTLSGNEISVQETVAPLADGFNFASSLPSSLAGQLQISASWLSGQGLGSLTLGDLSNTSSITVQQGAQLTVPHITLAASDSITVQGGAQVNGTAPTGGGTVLLSSPGTVDLQANSLVHATSNLTLNVNDINLNGGLKVDNGSLDLVSSEILFVPDGYTKASGQTGLCLTQALWQSFSGYSQLGLTSKSDLNFLTDVNLTVAGTLSIDASQFTGPANVTLNAKEIDLLSSSHLPVAITPGNPIKAGAGSLTLSAGTISVSLDSATAPTQNLYGDILFNGFGSVNLSSAGDLTLRGVGALKSTGDLNLTAARVTNSPYSDATTPYTAADFLVDATPGKGAISIASSGGTAGSGSANPGGSLSFIGRSITQSGVIETASGSVQLSATGSGSGDGIFLSSGAQILAQGTKQALADPNSYAYYPGGEITLQSAAGPVILASGSTLNVSAAAQGDAGSIALVAPTGGVTLNGSLFGSAAAGKGGSFTLDSAKADLTILAGTLATGGFTDQVKIRARQGDLALGAGQTLAAGAIELEADGGALAINGTLSADDGKNGGSVTVNAQNDLSVNGSILARGTAGGEVYLNSESGMLSQNGVIDVSGSSTGGSVTFRALQNGAGVNLTLPGQIAGAAQVVAEAFKVYSKTGNYTITTQDANGWLANAAGYIAGAVLPEGWGSASGTQYHFRPGIEIRGSGDISLLSNLDLSAVRFGGEPGVLTLRAGGNLNIGNLKTAVQLVDHPTASYSALTSATMQDSWGFNLVAGADSGAASPLAASSGPGSLTIAGGSLVYTEDAPINFAAAQNVTINKGVAAGYMINSGSNSMLYSLASYGGAVQGTVGGNLSINGGAIQTATGAIDLEVGGDLLLQNNGSIRSTGEYAAGTLVDPGVGTPASLRRQAQISDYWTYQNGGSIALDVVGSVDGFVNQQNSGGTGLANAWDWYYGGGTITSPQDQHLAASFEGANSTAGIATMGGGDISVRAGGAFTSQIGAFGSESAGNLDIVTGGNLNGRFRVMNGTASLTSGGGFGTARYPQVIEMANAAVAVSAQGNVYLGAVLDPDNTRNKLFAGTFNDIWNLTYSYRGETPTSADSSVSISSAAGNLTYFGQSSFDGYPTASLGAVTGYAVRQRTLPPVVSLLAAGDIDLLNDIYLAPSPTGNLQLFAGGSIDGSKVSSSAPFSRIFLTDQDPSTVYGLQAGRPGPNLSVDPYLGLSLVHLGDTNPVQISAGQNIQYLQLLLNKEAEISAGQDILQLVYVGENLAPTDVSRISAGRDIYYIFNAGYFPPLDPSQNYGILQGGPGTLVVQAGRNIDLGNSAGIQSVSNFSSPRLSSTGCDLIVAAGSNNGALQSGAVQDFFDALRQAGISYSNDLAAGDTADAQAAINQVRSATIATFFAAPLSDGGGSISMTQSQICTLGADSSISIMTRGDLSVGKSALSSSQDLTETGIYTAGGGAINIFSGNNVNVNESRVMTFLGGDITVWSDLGNVNAGRGSKTTVAASSPHYNPSSHVTTFSPPAVGSGVRGLTFDPNAVPGGPLPIPEPGDIYMFAPQGVIDAGEAGIAGGKVILGATQVLNAQNISFSAGSVGVPSSSGSSLSLGALAGAGSVADSGKLIEQSSGLGGAKEKSALQAATVDDFMSQWLDLKIISFDDDTPGTDENRKAKKK